MGVRPVPLFPDHEIHCSAEYLPNCRCYIRASIYSEREKIIDSVMKTKKESSPSFYSVIFLLVFCVILSYPRWKQTRPSLINNTTVTDVFDPVLGMVEQNIEWSMWSEETTEMLDITESISDIHCTGDRLIIIGREWEVYIEGRH